MAELLTLAEARASSELRNISGLCPTSSEFVSILNQAVRKLMTRGSWWGTVQRTQVCVYGGCLTWPRHVGTVLAINLNGSMSPPKNQWYEFLPMNRCDFDMGGAFPWLNGSFGWGALPTSDAGMSPVFNPVACGHPVYLRIYPGVRADVGARITIYGVDQNGLVVRTKVGGVWQEGETITLALPYTQTATLFREVTRITKPITQGVVRYYQWNPLGDFTYDLVWHDPGEMTPTYRVSRLPSGRSCCLKSVQALVKLQFVPVTADSDVVQISNLDAIADVMRSIREKNAGNIQEAQAYELSGVRELNLELREKFPADQTVTHVSYFGNNPMPRQLP